MRQRTDKAGLVVGKRAVLIAGPTASGKSALALARARELGGIIVNTDALQVYDGLRLLTARPGDADLAAGAAPALRRHRRRTPLLDRRLGACGGKGSSPRPAMRR